MLIDLVVIAVGLISFALFKVACCIFLRHVGPEGLLKTLTTILITTMGLPVLLVALLFLFNIIHVPWLIAIVMAILALGIHGLLCFIFIILVIGSFEGSIRMRLLWEIVKGKSRGTSVEEILNVYNLESIVQLRLCMLKGSGDIIKQQDLYRITSKRNFFHLFNIVSSLLRRWINYPKL